MITNQNQPIINQDTYNDNNAHKRSLWIDRWDFKYASNRDQRAQEAKYKNQYLDSEPTQLPFDNTQEKLMKLRIR